MNINNINANILKLTYDFSKKYLAQYIFAMTKPILTGVLGLILFSIIFLNPNYAFVAILSIPCICFAFWRGYVITYFLCDCADSFLKGGNNTFEEVVLKNKNVSKKLAGFVTFIALLSVLLYIPSFIYIFSHVNINNITNSASIINKAIFINTIILAPFLNYALQAYYYKKDNENYFKLFLNCYSKLNLQGVLIAFFITIFMTKLTEINPIIYIILALIFNVFIYGINTFWYLGRIKK